MAEVRDRLIAPISAEHPMRILLINPNTTQTITQLLLHAGQAVASPGTEIIAVTAVRGVPYIATRAEALLGGATALEMIAEHENRADVVIIGAFGDPGLFGARELFDIPVLGMSEASMLTACMMGRRFSIITFARALRPWYVDCIEMHGLSGRCASVRTLPGTFESITDIQEEKEALLIELANAAIDQDEADAIILAGAPLAGMANKVKDFVPVPLVDPIQSAVKQAEGLFALAPRKPTAGTFRRPDPKTTLGLPEPLASRIEHRANSDHESINP
jgi:Asp/Glu/hydantoin racemase